MTGRRENDFSFSEGPLKGKTNLVNFGDSMNITTCRAVSIVVFFWMVFIGAGAVLADNLPYAEGGPASEDPGLGQAEVRYVDNLGGKDDFCSPKCWLYSRTI